MQQFTILTVISAANDAIADEVRGEIYQLAENLLDDYNSGDLVNENVQMVRGNRITRDDILESNEIAGFGYLDPEDLGV
jgi:hypothetical protein